MTITKISPSVVDFDAGITITTDDNSNNLTITSTDADASNGPNIKFHRNSGSPADNDYGGYILFNAENDASEDTAFSYIGQQLIDVSNGTEDGRLFIYNMQAGTSVNAIDVLPTETVFNEGSVDRDFRVESNGNTAALFVDAGGGMVGFNTNTPTSDSGWTGFIHLAHTTNNAIVLDGTDSQQAGIGAVDGLYIDCMGHTTATNNNIIFRTTSTDNNHTGVERMRILSNGGITFNGDTAAANALDDYEEGTWTPTFFGTTQSVTMTNYGHYRKVGSLVFFTFYSGAQTFSSSSGSAGVSGLPFTSISGTYSPVSIAHANCCADTDLQGYVAVSSSVLYLMGQGNTAATTMVNGASKYAMISGCYPAN